MIQTRAVQSQAVAHRRDLMASVSSIGSQDLKDIPVNSAPEALAGDGSEDALRPSARAPHALAGQVAGRASDRGRDKDRGSVDRAE